MRLDATWNINGYWEAPRLLVREGSPMGYPEKAINISKCTIVITDLGFIDLCLNNKKVKRLEFKEFLKLKPYVKSIERNDINYV